MAIAKKRYDVSCRHKRPPSSSHYGGTSIFPFSAGAFCSSFHRKRAASGKWSGKWADQRVAVLGMVPARSFQIDTPTDLTLFIICLFARTSRSLTLCCPFGRPMIFPFNLAVSMPFFVRCLRSPTSFCA